MIKKFISAFFACLLLFSGISVAQSSVNVNPLTGTGNVSIPIYTVSSGQVAVPVSLAYVANGVKPKDVESTAGMNWQLAVGGQISRQVRGLPDDCTKDNLGKQRLGWMSALDTAANKVGPFTISNNGGVTCTDETTDISYITANFPFRNDTEPDLFYVSAPGLSCELIYSRDSSKFKPVTYQDLVITYTTVGGSGNNASDIASFTITNDRGIKYVFAAPETVLQSTTLGSTGTAVYLTTKYNQYINGITYDDSWNLTSITDAAGNAVTLSYSAAPPRPSTDPVLLYLNYGVSYTGYLQYYVQQTITPQTLNSIGTTNVNASATWLSFTWNTLSGPGQTGQTVISSITGMGRSFQFAYSPVVYTSTGYSRNFLRNFSDPGCSTPVNYQFSYQGESSTFGNYTTTLPDSASNLVDYWGYYASTASTYTLVPSVYVNSHTPLYQRYLIKVSASPGSIYDLTITNNNRAADPTVCDVGSLNKISYVQGGNTNIIYEPNDYYDVPSNSVVQGAGIRVKQIIDSVATGSTNNIVRNYTYVNSSGSSGKPVSLPQFSFTIPYSGSATGLSLWQQATALSAYDLSTEDHTIMYTSSKVSQTGAGSTVYSYNVPATYWDTAADPSCYGCTTEEWFPTLNYIGRNNCSLTAYGPVANYIYSYPFIPNPNYDFERGLPTGVTSFNDAGYEVSETDYTYQRSYTPAAISAFKCDENGAAGLSVLSYNKYTVFFNTSELPYTVTKKIFDSSNSGTSQASTTTYTYGSAYHKLLTQQTATNSDAAIVTTNYRYIKDFAPTNGTNVNIKAMYNLLHLNINAPVETYQQVTPPGATAVTTGASLTLFQGIVTGFATLYLPSQQLKVVQPDGASFTPFTINTGAQTISPDGNYFPVANFDKYDSDGYPATVDDANKHIQTTVFDHLTNNPTAVFKNTYSFEVAFNDFDTQAGSPVVGFTLTGTGSYAPVGSHTGNAKGMAAGQTETSGNLLRNVVAQNYIFSIWINAAAPGRITLTLPGSTAADTIHYSGGWKYYELKRPKSTASPYTVSFTTTQNISVDDILFYPDVAEVSTAAYDATTHYKTAQTNTNGVSAYLTNDQWGRALYTYDQDKNIVQKNTIITAADIASVTTARISSGSIINGQPATLGVYGPNTCTTAGITVTWNFGDGTIVTSPGLTSPSHTYHGLGTDTVRATVNSPLLGTIVLPYAIITVSGATIPLSYTNYTMSHGDISTVNFTPIGLGTTYSFTGAQLNTAHVIQGQYTIVVVLSDGQQFNSGTGAGYNSVDLNGSCGNWCANWFRSNSYTFTTDIGNCTSLAFTVSEYLCP